jgi:epoxyqueuosine reductase
LSKEAHRAKLIQEKAQALGFLACGISKARFLEEEAAGLESWLNNGYQGQMQWMENHFDKRLDPRKLMPGAKSVVSVLLNYTPQKEQQDPQAPKISKYAYGEDYHFVIKRKLKELLNYIQQEIGAVEGRAFVDSAPVMDRAWAKNAGLGWIGKHSLLLTKQVGSYYFIGELILDLALADDHPVSSHCGSCTKCIDACPTAAILPNGVVDGNRCISYLTIEMRGEIDASFGPQMENWAFGCDICQDVCPWNSFAKPTAEPAFKPHEDLLNMSAKQWHEITEDVFKKVFKKSAVKRAKYEGFTQNLHFLGQHQSGPKKEK